MQVGCGTWMGCRRGTILFQSAYDEASLVAEEDMVVYATHERLDSLVCYKHVIKPILLG